MGASFSILLGLLPFVGLALTILYFKKTAIYPFDALMRGALIWAFALVMVSNILSAFGLLSFFFILGFWILYIFFFAACLYRTKLPQIEWLKPEKYVYALICIALLTFIVAIVYPPNTWDSMTYHMPKVMHWRQNASLAHYYTSILRQTGLSPGAELIIFHSLVLSGTDYLANLVQWSAFIGIMCVAAAIASILGASRGGQILAALFFATLPMGIAQASSTQTDLAVGFWLSCAAARYLIWKTEATTSNAIYFGMAVGLAILTKGTGYVVSLPFVIAFAFYSIKKYKQLLLPAIISGIIAMVVFAPHCYRNYIAYNSPIVATHGAAIFSPTVKSFTATAVANIISNEPFCDKTLSNDPFCGRTKRRIDRFYAKLLTILHIDPKDSVIFPFGPVSERAASFSTHEDLAQNPLHALLLIWCLSGIGICYSKVANRYRRYVLASVLFFCLLFAWQPWITRLQAPLFALVAPLAGIALEKSCRKTPQNIVCVLLMLYCVPVLFWNASRPLAPVKLQGVGPNVWRQSRDELYFSNGQHLRERYLAAVDVLAKEETKSIGLIIGGDSWEYPLWALLRTRVSWMPEIQHVISQKTAIPPPGAACSPQHLFVLDQTLPWEKQDDIRDEPLRLFKLVNGAYERIF